MHSKNLLLEEPIQMDSSSSRPRPAFSRPQGCRARDPLWDAELGTRKDNCAGAGTVAGESLMSTSDVPLGFGIAAKSAQECRKADTNVVVVLHYADAREPQGGRAHVRTAAVAKIYAVREERGAEEEHDGSATAGD